MSDERNPVQPQRDHDATLWIVLGAGLIVLGLFFGARSLDIIPWPLQAIVNGIFRARYGLGVILLGVGLIVWATSGRGFSAPARGARLYRSRDNKWLAGVLGGLAEYFAVDPTVLRLAFIGLVVLLDFGALIAVYIVMAIVVPLEPMAANVPPAVDANWPTTGAPPAPPAAPTPPPAPPADGSGIES